MKKIIVLSVAATLFGVGVANAFLYTSEDATWWTSGATGDWMEQSNWTDYDKTAPYRDWIVAGWVVGNPENTGGSTDPLWNEGYACIDHGTVNITPASRPDGKVERTYVGSALGTSVLNISGDADFGRFLIGWGLGETGTVNLTSGTMNVFPEAGKEDQFRIAHEGNGIFNISGGTLNADLLILVYDNDAAGARLEISGGDVNLSTALEMRHGTSNATATVSVQGSSASIDVGAFTVLPGKGHVLELGLDAGGVSPINATSNAVLNDLAIVVDDLAGFNGSEGDTYDVVVSDTSISTSGLTVTSNIDGVEFGASVVNEGGKDILRLTILAPFEFQLPGTKMVPTGFQLQWNSGAGISYQLDVSTNLTDSPAFAVLATGIAGAAGTTEYIDTNASERVQAFYRVHAK